MKDLHSQYNVFTLLSYEGLIFAIECFYITFIYLQQNVFTLLSYEGLIFAIERFYITFI